MTPTWAVSLHDVAPSTWEDCETLLELVRPYGVPVTLLVTPHLHAGVRADADPAFAQALRGRLARGDEPVLHGYYHLDDATPPRSTRDWVRRRLLTAGEGEFAAITAQEAERRAVLGRAMLRGIGVEVEGFVPPAWQIAIDAFDAVARAGFRYVTTRDWLYPLPSGDPVHAPSLVYSTRTAWRRAASHWWNLLRLRSLALAPRVRVALHPPEARYRHVREAWRRMMDALAARRDGVLETRWLPRAGPPEAATRSANDEAAGTNPRPRRIA
ncbi:MAG: DUF2334 domain-containing protein [Pseudomonadota bacterium]